MVRREFDAIKVKDQLGKPDNIGIFGPFKKTEDLFEEEQPIIVMTNDITGMAVWDNPATIWDGVDTDDQWDTYNFDNAEIAHVVNFDNEFIWRFTHEETFDSNGNLTAFSFTDTDNTTATEDIVNNEVTFTTERVWQSKSAFKDSSSTQIVSSATLSVTVESGVFSYELSADGGNNWETVSLGVEHTFTNPGSDLRIRVTEISVQASFPLGFPIEFGEDPNGTITLIKCKYTI